MADQSLQQNLSQQLSLTPQMQQNLRILQSHSLELSQIVRQALDSNLFLEDISSLPSLDADFTPEPHPGATAPQSLTAPTRDDSPDNPSPLEASYHQESWLLPPEPRHSQAISPDRLAYLQDSQTAEPTLEAHLLAQLASTSAPTPDLQKAAEYLAQNLDARGFLETPLDELARLARIPAETLREAQIYLQQFDPAGIAADNLLHSLRLQLDALPSPQPARPLAREILSRHLPLLAARKVPELAKTLGTTPERVSDAISLIASLNPRPAANFSREFNPEITPDIVVLPDSEGKLEAIIPDSHLPKLTLSRFYRDLITSSKLTEQERNQLRAQLKDARSLMNGLAFRQSTLQALGNALILAQPEFFTQGPDFIRPLTMNEVAETLHVHPTTVSRTVANKYIQTPFGIFDLRRLFTGGFESGQGEAISDARIKSLIREFIAREPDTKPLSDAKISSLLAEQGLTVARRTIAKYRDQLGILPTHLRKRQS